MRQDVVQPMDISRIVKSWPRFWPLLALITVLGLSVAPAQAQTLAAGGALALDAAGNIYGTTVEAGRYGYGVVFEITP